MWAIASINSPELSGIGTSSLVLVNGRDVVKGVER
jgi:hypothetical protein